jgi:hypothetical protein
MLPPMDAFVFNLFSEFTETIGYKTKREVIKKRTCFRPYASGDKTRKTSIKEIPINRIMKVFLSSNHDASN